MLLILASVYKNYLVMQLKASFNQRLAVLTPKISDQEHEDVSCHKPLLESKEKAPSKLQAIPEQGLEGAFSPSENRLDRYEIPVSQMYSF
jgi:hypothetical protein